MNVIVVIAPPTSWGRNRGFRHAVVPGEARALCGRNVEDWMGDARTIDSIPFEQAQVGCKVCIRAHGARQG
jgi:hypothetical protein